MKMSLPALIDQILKWMEAKGWRVGRWLLFLAFCACCAPVFGCWLAVSLITGGG